MSYYTYINVNTAAAIIASYGLLTQNIIVSLGGAIIAMLLDSVVAISSSLINKDRLLFKQSSINLVNGVVITLIVSFIISLIHHDMPITSDVMMRTSFNLIDFIIACTIGFTYAYAIVTPQLNRAIIGVAMAPALMLPLASAGILIARSQYLLAFNAIILACINIVTILSISFIVLRIFKVRKKAL